MRKIVAVRNPGFRDLTLRLPEDARAMVREEMGKESLPVPKGHKEQVQFILNVLDDVYFFGRFNQKDPVLVAKIAFCLDAPSYPSIEIIKDFGFNRRFFSLRDLKYAPLTFDALVACAGFNSVSSAQLHSDFLLILSDQRVRSFIFFSLGSDNHTSQTTYYWAKTFNACAGTFEGDAAGMFNFACALARQSEYAAFFKRQIEDKDLGEGQGLHKYFDSKKIDQLQTTIGLTLRKNSGVFAFSLSNTVDYLNSSWVISDEILMGLNNAPFSRSVPSFLNDSCDTGLHPNSILEWSAAEIKGMTAINYVGRSIVFQDGDGQIIILKFLKLGESLERLAAEAAKADHLGVRLPELGISGFKWRSSRIFSVNRRALPIDQGSFNRQLQEGEIALDSHAGRLAAIGYRVAENRLADFTTYFEDIPWQKTAEPFSDSMRVMGLLAKEGLFHQSLTTLPQFHSTDSGREWLWNISSRMVQFNRQILHSGTLGSIFDFKFSNLRSGMVADFDHLESITDLVHDTKGIIQEEDRCEINVKINDGSCVVGQTFTHIGKMIQQALVILMKAYVKDNPFDVNSPGRSEAIRYLEDTVKNGFLAFSEAYTGLTLEPVMAAFSAHGLDTNRIWHQVAYEMAAFCSFEIECAASFNRPLPSVLFDPDVRLIFPRGTSSLSMDEYVKAAALDGGRLPSFMGIRVCSPRGAEVDRILYCFSRRLHEQTAEFFNRAFPWANVDIERQADIQSIFITLAPKRGEAYSRERLQSDMTMHLAPFRNAGVANGVYPFQYQQALMAIGIATVMELFQER